MPGLAVVLANNRLTVAVSKPIRVAFATSQPGRATLTVLHGKTKIKTVVGTVKRSGSTSLTTGRLPAGRYSVAVTVKASDGRSTTDRGRLTVVRGR